MKRDDSTSRRPWWLRERAIVPGPRPRLMGIVNVTPDSFSDGGQFLDPEAAIEHGLRLAIAGAEVLDVGGESTRPGAEPIDADEELRRVMPVVAGLVERSSVPVSIDTSKARVAREALQAGAEAINDVTGLESDPAMVAVAARFRCGVCAMHMRGEPRTMQQAPRYDDVVAEVFDYLARRRDVLRAAGIAPERIALDPGIGFGKTTAHNLAILRSIGRFRELGCAIVVGHSRKRFIGDVLGNFEADRTAGTVGVALALAREGVELLRVHDVAAVEQALRLFELAGGLE